MDSKPSIIFRTPKEDYVSRALDVNTGLEMINSLVKFARKLDVSISEFSIPAIAKAFRQLVEGWVSRLPVEALRKIFEGFRSDYDNIVALTAYDAKYRAAWEYILRSPVISNAEVEKIYGKPIGQVCVTYRWEKQIFIEALFYPLLAQSKYQSFYGFMAPPQIRNFMLPAPARRYLASKILGEESVKMHFVKALPDDKDLKVTGFEMAITGGELLMLEGIAVSGNPLKNCGEVMAAKLRKIENSKFVAPFEIGNPLLNRAELVSMIAYSSLPFGAHGLPVEKVVRFVVDRFKEEIYGTQLKPLLPALDGLNKSITESAELEVFDIIHSMVKQADGKWLDLSNFVMLMLCGECKIDTLRALSVIPFEMTSMVFKRDLGQLEPIRDLGLELTANWLQTLCAFGIIDIAYDLAAPQGDTLYGMRYLRLTELGRYAFGLVDSYAPQFPGIAPQVEYDAENQIIEDGTPDSPFAMLLERIAQPIGRNRYLISARSIARDCQNLAAIDERLRMLRPLLSEEAIEAVTPLFEQAKTRRSCAKIATGYDMITIRPELDELRLLLTSDKRFTKMLTPLGRNVFLIRSMDRYDFTRLLDDEGFSL